jgi:hypothetical protein
MNMDDNNKVDYNIPRTTMKMGMTKVTWVTAETGMTTIK